MGEFSFEGLRWWRKKFIGIEGYKTLCFELDEGIKKNVKSIPDGRQEKGKQPFGMVIPIIDKAWGVKDVNGITNGALITFAQRFIIYDFSAQQAYSYNYDQIGDVFSKDSEVQIDLENNESLIMEMSEHTDTTALEKTKYIEGIADFFKESRTAKSHYNYVENMRALEFDARSALRYAKEARIEEWVH